MIRALTKIGYGVDACIIGPGAAGSIDPRVTFIPSLGARPFVRGWRIEEEGRASVIVLDIADPEPPRGAA